MKDINNEDLLVLSGCDAAHPDRRGGQHVAMTCAGVMIIHVPTGLAVRVLDERSQLKNKQKALARLREVLQAMEHWDNPVFIVKNVTLSPDQLADLKRFTALPSRIMMLEASHPDACRCETCKTHA